MDILEQKENSNQLRCSIASVARCYLRNGFSIIPVKTNSKEPTIKWKDYTSHHMIEDLVEDFFLSNSNIAIVTGAVSNITVIDVDGNKFDEFYSFDKLKSETKTIVKTPRGYHFYFLYDPVLKTSQFQKYGFDVKNNNSLVTSPPSKINGFTYHFLKSEGLTEIPQGLKSKILTLQHIPTSNLKFEFDRIISRLKVSKQLQDGIYRCYCPSHDDQEPSLDVGIKDGNLYIKCWAGCTSEQILQAIEIETPKGKETENRTAKQLLRIAEKFDLWIDHNGDEFVSINNDGKIKNLKIESKEFRKLFQFQYFEQYGKPAHTQAILEVINTLSGKAYIKGKKIRSFVRIGKIDDAVELDLCTGEIVHIERDKILVTNPICKFEQPSNLLPLPKPDLSIEKDDWKILSKFINTSEEGLILTIAWLIGCFNIDGEFPILNIVGEREGIGKTTASKFIKSILDPSTVSNKPMPKNEDDLLTVCLHNHIVAFDNLSHISDVMSDALCRVSTGSGLAKRKLFTDAEVVLYYVKNPLILNGIDFFAERRDLRRRCIHIELEKLTNPKPINQLEWAFKLNQPKLLGWLCKAVQLALREDIYEQNDLTDMASFVEYICKTEKLFPVSAKNFIEMFKANRFHVSVSTVFENPIVSVLLELIENGEWKGTVIELHEIIKQKFIDSFLRLQIPKDAKSLSRKIKRMLTDLENLGVVCEFNRDSKSTYIHIKRIEKNISITPLPQKPLINKDFLNGDIMEINGDIQNNSTISPLNNSLKNKDNLKNGDNGDKKTNLFNKSEGVIGGSNINPYEVNSKRDRGLEVVLDRLCINCGCNKWILVKPNQKVSIIECKNCSHSELHVKDDK